MVKTTKEFIKQFKLDQENYEFNREDFLKELNKYLLEMINNAQMSTPNFTFDIFKQCVNQVAQKFWAISNKKAGGCFSKDLWNAFYAVYVVPLRAKHFPQIEAEIQKKRLGYKKSSNNKTETKLRKS